MPIITVAPNNDLLEKLKSNLQEVRARGGELYVFADPESGMESSDGVHVIEMPRHVSYFQAPAVHTIPLQLLAHHCTIHKGADVDQPQNLEKSVKVEWQPTCECYRKGLARSISSSRPGSSGFHGLPGCMTETWQLSAASTSCR
jgi:hypothetical protein